MAEARGPPHIAWKIEDEDKDAGIRQGLIRRTRRVDFRPFEILKMIRDKEIVSLKTIYEYVGSADAHLYNHLIGGLIKLGLLAETQSSHPSGDTKIATTPAFKDLLRSLQISLTTLEPLSPQSRKSIVVNPIFENPKGDNLRADVFVIMPFRLDLQPAYDAIRLAASALGLSIKRGDEDHGAHAIISDIWDAVVHARVIVADLTGCNANVFYEIGMAHTLGKKVILVSQDIITR